MGFEFQGHFAHPLATTAISQVLHRIATLPEVVLIEEPAADTVRLRFADHERRDVWPEDIVVELTGRGCYVLFHSGSRNDQGGVLTAITDVLGQHGIACTFEEL